MFINVEDDKCSIVKINGSDICNHLIRSCDKYYYSLAIKYYCSHHYPSTLLTFGYSTVVLFLLSILLLTLSIIVSNYFFRNLKNLAKIFKINNQILSFLLIPLANAAPDMINYYISMDAGTIELMLGQVIGSTLISLSLIMAFIIIIKPFSVANYKIVIIDFFLLFLVLVMLLIIISDGKITFIECSVMVACYFIYLVYLNKFDKVIEEDLEEEFTVDIEETMSILSNEDINPVFSPLKHPEVDNVLNINNNFKILSISMDAFQLIFDIIDKFLSLLIPISSYDADEIDYNEMDNENGEENNQMTATVIYKTFRKLWFFIEVPLILNYQFVHTKTLYTIVISILLFALTAHINFSEKLCASIINIVGILNSLVIISHISVHILQLLKNFGFIIFISDYLLGLLVFSIGNSVNDMVTNFTIATKINPILGLNACIGTPILIILLGIGFNGILVLLKKSSQLTLNFDIHLLLTTLGLILIMAFYLCCVPLNKWRLDRKIGTVLLVFYICMFTINCFL